MNELKFIKFILRLTASVGRNRTLVASRLLGIRCTSAAKRFSQPLALSDNFQLEIEWGTSRKNYRGNPQIQLSAT